MKQSLDFATTEVRASCGRCRTRFRDFDSTRSPAEREFPPVAVPVPDLNRRVRVRVRVRVRFKAAKAAIMRAEAS